MEIGREIAQLHRAANLFGSSAFQVSSSHNILNTLGVYPEFRYLSEFYSEYRKAFANSQNEPINAPGARSRDLPFIGENVLKNGTAKFMWVFEGSLSRLERLSITVLSHLWLTENPTVIGAFCGFNGWWTERNYLNVRNRLRLSVAIGRDSYVVDAIRFSQQNRNDDLIDREIRLLNPKIVICVGDKARKTVGMRYRAEDTKYHHVRFPKYHSDDTIYDELSDILSQF